MDIQKLIQEEQEKLNAKNKREVEERERRKREEYENDPDTIMQNEMRELLPVIASTVEKFAQGINGIFMNEEPASRLLAVYQIATKKGLFIKKPDRIIVRVLVGIRTEGRDRDQMEYRFASSCRLALRREEMRHEFNSLPAKDKLEEWLLRELAKFYSKWPM